MGYRAAERSERAVCSHHGSHQAGHRTRKSESATVLDESAIQIVDRLPVEEYRADSVRYDFGREPAAVSQKLPDVTAYLRLYLEPVLQKLKKGRE